MDNSKDPGVCVVVGAGEGNGAALARRFSRDGGRVAMLARDRERLCAQAREIAGSVPVVCDATDEASLSAAFECIRAELGPVRTLIYNAGNFVLGSVHDTPVSALDQAFQLNCVGLLRSVQCVLPAMQQSQAGGEIIVIGATASRRGAAHALPFAAAKAGQRSIAQSMARALGPQGIHVAHVVIDGVIDSPHTRLFFPDKPDAFFVRPDAVAETVAMLVKQERCAWTFELEVRPSIEVW